MRGHTKSSATIPVGTGPRPGTISPDGKRLYMNVDDLMGFLVIDTAARKVVSKGEMTLTPDEQAVRSRSHGIAVANDGKEVWVNDVVHNRDVCVRRHSESAEANRAASRSDGSRTGSFLERHQDRLRRVSRAATSSSRSTWPPRKRKAASSFRRVRIRRACSWSPRREARL